MSKQQNNKAPQFRLSKRVSYIDASALNRPQKITGPSKVFATVVIVAGLLVGGVATYAAVDALVLKSLRADAQMEEMLKTEIPVSLPRLKHVVNTSNEETRAYLESNGATLVDVPASKQNNEAMDVFTVSPNSSAEETAALLEKGISRLNSYEFTKLMYGAWRMDVDQKTGYTVRVRYADFSSGSMESAMSTAMGTQKLTSKDVSESGEDESGNTYKTGTVRIGTNSYTWRVSVLPLKEMYKTSGLPEDAYFVGLRYSKL